LVEQNSELYKAQVTKKVKGNTKEGESGSKKGDLRHSGTVGTEQARAGGHY